MLWWHYIVNGNSESSQQIYNDHLKSLAVETNCGPILCEAAAEADERPLILLIKILKASPTHREALGEPVSALLNMLCGKHRFDDAIEILKEIRGFINLENINSGVLERIKIGYESNNQDNRQFPYKIPTRNMNER